MTTIAVMNQKGGVGKTTASVNLASALARGGKRVLLVDVDPQANATSHLGIDAGTDRPSLYDVMVRGTALADVLVEVEPGLQLAPAELDLSAAELELVSAVGRETILRDALDRHLQTHAYSYVLIDCPPSLGLLSLNGLAAANEVYVVLQPEFFALQGMATLENVVRMVATRIRPELAITGIVISMYDGRTRLGQEVVDEIRGHFGSRVYDTRIRRNVKLAEAPSHGQSIFAYDGRSTGARDYQALAAEMAMRHGDPLVTSRPRSAGARGKAARRARKGCGLTTPTVLLTEDELALAPPRLR